MLCYILSQYQYRNDKLRGQFSEPLYFTTLETGSLSLTLCNIFSRWGPRVLIGSYTPPRTPPLLSTIFQCVAPSGGQFSAPLHLLLTINHRLNMEVDLQSLFGLHVTWCAQLYSMAETPQLPPFPRIWTRIRGRYWSAKMPTFSQSLYLCAWFCCKKGKSLEIRN